MLDFYFIKDEQTKPEYPEIANLEFGIGLNYDTFEKYIQKSIIDSRFDYYSDFRWSLKLIEQILARINKNKIDSNFYDLKPVLERALELKCGLIAYCD